MPQFWKPKVDERRRHFGMVMAKHFSQVSQQRRWEAIPGSKAKKENMCSFDFLVLSYNILSQQLLEDNPWLYHHCHRDVLSWAFRFPRLISEISRFNADIVCLQEVQYSHFYNQIKPALSEMGYKCRYKVRTGDKRDGCAICFKRSRFDLLSWKPVEYFHPGVPVLNRDNVGGIVMLRPLGVPEGNKLVDLQFCVANTHLLYNPRRGDVKLAQLAVLLAEIDRTSRQENSQCPVLLCGDFNSVPGSPLYRFIRDGSLYYRQMPIWQVSGQEELRGVNWNVLEAPLWPRSVGISPCCRYHERSPPRDKEQANEEREARQRTFDGDSSIHTSPAETKQDFNEQPSPPQRLAETEGCSIQTGEENFPNTIRHGMSFHSVYSHFIQAQGKAEATTCHSKTGVTVDYIFYSNPTIVSSPGKELTGVQLRLLERLALLSVTDLWNENRLPNEVASSDHLPLLAKFRLEWKKTVS
uniref:protein angel homolog 2-like isoform X3 n=1 Tax=Myxine glutinosa TaxID=7769 RepID=UPI00358EC0E7